MLVDIGRQDVVKGEDCVVEVDHDPESDNDLVRPVVEFAGHLLVVAAGLTGNMKSLCWYVNVKSNTHEESVGGVK